LRNYLLFRLISQDSFSFKKKQKVNY